MITNIQSLICEINPRGKLTTNVLFYEKKYNLDCWSNAISQTDPVYFSSTSPHLTSYFYLFLLPNCSGSNKILHLRRLWFSVRFERWFFLPGGQSQSGFYHGLRGRRLVQGWQRSVRGLPDAGAHQRNPDSLLQPRHWGHCGHRQERKTEWWAASRGEVWEDWAQLYPAGWRQ